MTSQTLRSSLRIAHCADLHLGASYAHGDEDKGGVNSRLVDFREAWVRSCNGMVAAKVDLVLFAGDAFRDAKPTPTEIAAFRWGLDILQGAGVPMVMITGNHDQPRQVGRTHALAVFDEYENVIVADRPCIVFAPGIPELPIACFPYPSRAYVSAQDPEFEKLTLDEQNAKIVELSLATLRGLAAEAEQGAGAFGSVLVGHAAITGSTIGAEQSTMFLREPVLPASELKGLPFAYQAWGHLHKAQQLAPHIRYSGSIERCDFAEADEGKGWWEVELPVTDGSPITWHSSEPQPFVDIDLENPADGEGGLCQYPEIMIMDAIVRVTYTATPEVAKTVDHTAIRRALMAAGAVKVHGPFAKITHTVTDSADGITEDTDVQTGWHSWADLRGLSGAQRARLDQKVGESLEATL